jgi:hypothetical protein
MRTNDQIAQAEIDRLSGVFGRAGKGEAGVIAMYTFAEQTFRVYRSCRKGDVRKKYGKAYKRELIISAWVLRGVLGNGRRRNKETS